MPLEDTIFVSTIRRQAKACRYRSPCSCRWSCSTCQRSNRSAKLYERNSYLA